MIIVLLHVIISFLMDGLLSNYMSIDIVNPSYFRTIFSVISLVVIYNYFDNTKKYLYILVILGLLFDIVVTNTLLLNVFIFFIIYFVTDKLNYYIPNNLFTINFKTLFGIVIYHVLTYLFLQIGGYHYYPVKLLWLIISRSIIMTILYTSVSYLIFKKMFFKKYDKKIK